MADVVGVGRRHVADATGREVVGAEVRPRVVVSGAGAGGDATERYGKHERDGEHAEQRERVPASLADPENPRGDQAEWPLIHLFPPLDDESGGVVACGTPTSSAPVVVLPRRHTAKRRLVTIEPLSPAV